MSLFTIDLTREPCAVDGCKERPRYTGEFGERLCGPHLRDQRREAAELAAAQAPNVTPTPSPAPPEPVPDVPTLTTQEIPMPLEPTKIPLPLCQWPGCGRVVLRHRWCARDIQRVRILGEKPDTTKDAAELARAWDARQAVSAADRNRHPSPAAAAPVPAPVVVDVILVAMCTLHGAVRPKAECDVCSGRGVWAGIEAPVLDVDTDTDTDTKTDSAGFRLRDDPLDQIASLIGTDPDGSDAEIVAAVEAYVRTRDELHTQLETAQKGVEDATFLRQAIQMLGSPRDRDLEVGLEQLTDADGALVAELIARCLKAKTPTPGAVLTGEELTQRWNAWEEAKNLELQRNNLLGRIAHEYTQLTCGFSPGDAFVDVLDTRIAMLRRVALGGA